MRRVMWMILIFVLMAAPVAVAQEGEEEEEFVYGLTDRPLSLRDSPNNNAEITIELEPQTELLILDEVKKEDGTTWLQVGVVSSSETGWLKAGGIESPIESSQYQRKYASGSCTAQPLTATFLPLTPRQDWRWNYPQEIAFEEELDFSEVEDLQLFFNGQQRIGVRFDFEPDFDYEVRNGNEVRLHYLWAGAHSGFDPQWSDIAAWLAKWSCEEEVEPTETPQG